MKPARIAVPAAALLLVLSGCGGDDDQAPASSLTQDEQTAADNLGAQIVRSSDMSGRAAAEGSVTESQAECIAEGAVREVGLDSLQEYGIVTDDLLVNKSIQGVEMVAEDADALATVFVECIDAEALFEERFLGGLRPKGSDQPDEALQACVEEAVGEGAVRKVLSASFQGRRTAAYAKLQKRVSACDGNGQAGQ